MCVCVCVLVVVFVFVVVRVVVVGSWGGKWVGHSGVQGGGCFSCGRASVGVRGTGHGVGVLWVGGWACAGILVGAWVGGG